eukprot:839273-Rhodomonas_salina.1
MEESLGGGSIYFDEPIEAQLASLPKPLCSQLQCQFSSYKESTDMMNELTILCEGAVTGNFTYHDARSKH